MRTHFLLLDEDERVKAREREEKLDNVDFSSMDLIRKSDAGRKEKGKSKKQHILSLESKENYRMCLARNDSSKNKT